MTKLYLFLACLSLLLASSYSKVRPFGARSIVLSSTNAGDVANYNFTMTLDTELPAGGVVEISFPFNQYIAGLGLPYNFKVYAPYPTQITATLDTDTAKTVICDVGHRKANESFTVEIRDVKNPSKVGGTGNFKVSSKIGSKVLDSNDNFGVIGIFEESTTLLTASINFIDAKSQLAGEYTSYDLSFVPSVNLPSNIDIKVIFPVVYDFTSVQPYQCTEVGGLGLSLKCRTNNLLKNVIVFEGFVKPISQGTSVKLQLADVLNPNSEMTTEALSFWVREVGTNNTIQKAEGVSGLYIQPGTISDVLMYNPTPSFPLYTNIDRELVLSFRPSNPFNIIKIATSFPLVKTCTVINGLSMVDETTPIICSPSSHVMIIKGQKTYVPQDIYLKVVKIKFLATMPSDNVLTNKVEIYTFLDDGFIQKVDQDLDSGSSQVQIVDLTNVNSVASTLTTTSTLPNDDNIITFTIEPAVAYTAAPQVVLEISSAFTGVPSCSFALADSGTYATKTCTLKKGVLTIAINANIDDTFTTPASIKITGLKNPSLPDTYSLRYYVYSSTSVIAESFLNTFTVTTETISTITMVPVADAVDHTTIYSLKFTTPSFLEDGFFLLDEPNKLSSRIDILFMLKYTSSDTFYYDLGSGLPDRSDYPCEFAGLNPSVFAKKPRCILIHGPSTGATTSDAAVIRVVDFQAVLKGTSLTINIPVINSQLGSTAPTAIVRTYVIKEYEEFVTAEKSLNLQSPSSNLGSAATASSISLTNQSVQAISDLQFSFTISSAISAGSNNSIFIEYPNGYKFPPENITVKLDGTTVSPDKLHFADVYNILSIELSSALTASSHTVLIQNMRTPNASLSSGNTLIARTSQANVFVHRATFTMPTIQPGGTAVTMSVFPNKMSHPYATYEFNFTTTAYSPNTASIKITFPAGYTLDANTECILIDGLKDKSATLPVTCSNSASSVTVSQFSELAPSQNITIKVFGITNPSSSVAGLNYVVSILNSVSDKIESFTFTGTASTLSGTFSAQDLNITVARLTPRNPLVDAGFLMTLDPGYSLPKGAVLKIDFDPAFSVLFTQTVDLIDCIAQGGLYSLHDCSVSGVQLTLKLGETSNASVPIDIYYFGFLRFPSAQTTLTGFAATLIYKSITIASSSSFPTIATSDPIVPLNDISMDYYPRNEGEMANYYFTFNLTTTFLNSSMYFLIRFPHEYDANLFKYFPIAESSQLVGYLNVDVLSRQLIIYGLILHQGFQNMTVVNPITIRLWGIVNPNKVDISRTGAFTFALMYQDEALEANFNIRGIVPLLAPDSIQFISLNSTSYYARQNNDFTFSFLTRKDIMTSELGGKLFIDFPPDYLIDSYAGKCDIDQDFSFFVNCNLDNNRIFINASNPLWTTAMGALTLFIRNVRTPDDDGETLNFVVSNYDSVGKRILSRSYGNLNPASLSYIYDGMHISVNNDEPVEVEVGTYTDEIVIKMPGPSLQTLTLTPNTLDARILVTPFPLKIELGETETRFRVAAPREILLKSFYITWSKTGDSLVTTYANLRRTNLRMRSGWVKREIASENMEFIPVGGLTFPLLVATNNPPYDELIVNLQIQNGDTEATLNRQTLTLGRGQFSQNYSISISNTHPTTNIQVGLSLAGKDGPSYLLTNTTITIPIIPRETSPPNIISDIVVDTTRSTATFQIEASTLSFIYYVVAYEKMPAPTFQDVSTKTANQTLMYSNPHFAETYIKRTPKVVTFTVTDLEPGRNYDMYAYVMNLNQVNNPNYVKLSFSTNKPHRTAEFILPIKQTTVPSDMRKEIITRIAQMLSVERTRLIEKTTDCVQSQDSLYYHAANTTYFHLFLLPDPTSENDNSTPLKLVRNLNTRTDEIKQFIPRLADGDLLQIQDLPYDLPTYTVRPSYKKNEYESLKFTVTLARCGYIHAIALPVPLSQNNTATLATVYESEAPPTDLYPTSFQIYSGYDTGNQPAIYKKMRANDFSKDYELEVPGLKDNLIYKVYITTQNDWPLYNELIPDTSVARIEAKTVKKRSKQPLNVFSINIKDYTIDDSGSSHTRASWIALLLIFIVTLLV